MIKINLIALTYVFLNIKNLNYIDKNNKLVTGKNTLIYFNIR